MGATDQHRETIPVLVFFIAGDFASADATRGLSAHPLDPLGLILFPDSPAPSACAFSLLASAHSTKRSAATLRSIHVSQNEKLAAHLGAFLSGNSMNTSILDFIRCKGNELPQKKQKTHPDNPLVQERIAGMLAYHRITRTPLQMPRRTPGKTKYRTMQSCRSSP